MARHIAAAFLAVTLLAGSTVAFAQTEATAPAAPAPGSKLCNNPSCWEKASAKKPASHHHKKKPAEATPAAAAPATPAPAATDTPAK